MGSKVEVWKLVEPVTPCGRVRNYSSRKLKKGVDLHKLQEEIASVGARVHSIDEQIALIKAALPELDNKIRYASLGMPMSSFPLDELQNLQTIHFKLLHFWEDLSRKQLEKLEYLSHCLQELELEEQKGGSKAQKEIENYKEIKNYKEIGQHVSEKVQSDIRKNQELEEKLHFDRISCVPTSSKPTPTFYSPPKRGPQQIGREHQVSGPSTPADQWIPTRLPPAQRRIPPPSPPAQRRIPTPSPPAHQWTASGQSCKESVTTPSAPVLQSPSVCTIKV